jgi:PKHD-type hydroxylase
MRLKYHWWTFKKAISNHLCDEIVKYANLKNFEKGTVGSPKKELNLEEYQNNLKQIRDSNVVWLNEQWVHNEIIPYVTQANINANWNFELNGFESLQFTKYDVGQFYDWHPDQFEPVNEEDNPKKTIRKLSVSVLLSDEKDYEGGDLQFRDQVDGINRDPFISTKISTVEEKSRGTVIVFPSFMWHRVTPVTKGIRYSLVMWNTGYPFR